LPGWSRKLDIGGEMSPGSGDDVDGADDVVEVFVDADVVELLVE
jgi:hypothetical protein